MNLKKPHSFKNLDCREWYRLEEQTNPIHIKGNEMYKYEYTEWLENKLQLLIDTVKTMDDTNPELTNLFKVINKK